MQNNLQSQNINEDEIDLRELFNTILEKKFFILIFTSLVTVAAIFYAYSKTPIYEVKSNVQIGFIDDKLITNPDTLVKTLNIVFNVEDKAFSKEEYTAIVSSINKNKKIKNFIEIKTEGISNPEALKLNKEVVKYIKDNYKSTIEQHILNTNNKILSIKKQIYNLENFETENIKREIKLLRKQAIVKIDEKIKFLENIVIPSLSKKITFHKIKLKEYTKAINKIYSNNKKTKDTTLLSISSMQIVNYQNLILNSQNKIEDLQIKIEEIKIDKISNLQREKNNIQNDKIRKLQYKLDIGYQNKKIKLQEQIAQLKFQTTKQFVQNSYVVGEYVVHDYPIKPKKKLIVIVAFITGLILSIFLVFFLNFISIKE